MWKKAIQRRFYSFLSTKWGVGLCVVGALLTMSTAIRLLTVLVSQHEESCASVDFGHNIMERSYEKHMYFEPIDVVYVPSRNAIEIIDRV